MTNKFHLLHVKGGLFSLIQAHVPGMCVGNSHEEAEGKEKICV